LVQNMIRAWQMSYLMDKMRRRRTWPEEHSDLQFPKIFKMGINQSMACGPFLFSVSLLFYFKKIR
jgi:hypothetical protein